MEGEFAMNLIKKRALSLGVVVSFVVLGCGDMLAPSFEHVRPSCSADQACTAPLICHEGLCLEKVERCDNDGVVDPGEDCDDGNAVETDACTNTCKVAACGDGIQRADINQGEAGFEACDDGNAVNTDGCLNGCVLARCGDGLVRSDLAPGVEGSEDCDDLNGAMEDACTNTCKAARCGDGILRADLEVGDENFEACDDGDGSDANACTNACTLAVCGDGVVHAGLEACDDGNDQEDDGCRNDCTVIRCGDGVVDGGEGCDDANAEDGDDCTNACTLAACGDGSLRSNRYLGEEGYEVCDDGNESNGDACVGDCVPAVCGDGFVREGVETCDDGNAIDDDGCPNSCGAGYVALEATATRRCAVSESGELVCWGSNEGGYFHEDLPEILPSATEIPGYTDLTELCLGDSGFCTLSAQGAVRCAGQSSRLHLDRPEGLPAARGVACLDERACAVSSEGVLTCWGASYEGGEAQGYLIKAGVEELSVARVRIHRLSTGMATCILTNQGAFDCWGELPQGWSAPTNQPAFQDCQLDWSGSAHCLEQQTDQAGNAEYRVYENGNIRADREYPRYKKLLSPFTVLNEEALFLRVGVTALLVTEFDRRVVDVALDHRWLGSFHIPWGCVLNWRRQPACWGENRWGQIGNGDSELLLTPTRMSESEGVDHLELIDGAQLRLRDHQFTGLLSAPQAPPQVISFTALTAASACVIDRLGDVRCTGQRGKTGLGLAALSSDDVRTWQEWPLETGVMRLEAHQTYGCSKHNDERLWCHGTALAQHTPIALESPAMDFAVAQSGGCAVSDGDVWCWGQVPAIRSVSITDEQWSQAASQTEPGRMSIDIDFTKVAIGSQLCGVSAQHAVWCFVADQGWLEHEGLERVSALEGAFDHQANGYQCALAQGRVWCWGGLNSDGQLGAGFMDRAIEQPRQVRGLEEAQRLTVTPTNVCAYAQDHWQCWGRALNNQHDSRRLYPVARAH